MAISFDRNPFIQMLDNFAKPVTHTPVTKTTDNISGAETLTDGTPVQISITFYRQEDIINQAFEGLFQGADAVALYRDTITINKNDKITYDGQTYRVEKDPTTRRLGTVIFYKVARLFKI